MFSTAYLMRFRLKTLVLILSMNWVPRLISMYRWSDSKAIPECLRSSLVGSTCCSCCVGLKWWRCDRQAWLSTWEEGCWKSPQCWSLLFLKWKPPWLPVGRVPLVPFAHRRHKTSSVFPQSWSCFVVQNRTSGNVPFRWWFTTLQCRIDWCAWDRSTPWA